MNFGSCHVDVIVSKPPRPWNPSTASTLFYKLSMKEQSDNPASVEIPIKSATEHQDHEGLGRKNRKDLWMAAKEVTGSLTKSLLARVIAGAVFVFLVGSMALAYFISVGAREMHSADVRARLSNRAAQSSQQFTHEIDAMSRIALALTHVPPIERIQRAQRDAVTGPINGDPVTFWKARLAEIFTTFARTNPEYFQTRYIGADGREIVRVDSRNGQATVTPDHLLQNKADRDYFKEASTLASGQVYVSDINLNRERGKIQIPHVRMLRVATPIFSSDGARAGIIVINADVGPLIDKIGKGLADNVRTRVINSRGDYLAHPDPERTFGFDVGRRYTFQDEFPNMRLDAVTDWSSPQWLTRGDGSLRMAVARIELDKANPNRDLFIAYQVTDSKIDSAIAAVRNRTLAGVVVIGFAGLALLLWAIRVTFAPLISMRNVAERVGKGDRDAIVDLPPDSGGEIGSVVRGFRVMLKGIEKRENELHSALTQTRALHESAPDPVIITDDGDRITVVNKQTEHVFGYSRDELLGQPLEMLISERLEDHSSNQPALPASTGGSEREMRARRKDGSEFPVEISLSPIDSEEGSLVIRTIRDISERQRATRDLLRFRMAIDTTLDGIFLVDFKSGRYVDVNRTACSMLGFTRDELLTMGPVDISPDVGHQAQLQMFEAAKARGPDDAGMITEERMMKRKDGSEFPAEVTRRYLCIGSEELIVGVARDISARRKAESRVRSQLSNLHLLDHITRAVGERQDPDSIFQVVVGSLEDSLPVEFACICLYDQQTDSVTVQSVGVKGEALSAELGMQPGSVIEVGANGLSRCVRGHLVHEPDIAAAPYPFPQRLAAAGLRTMVLAPLRSESRIFGVLLVARRKPESFSSTDCEFLRQLSEHVALSTHQAQLFDSLQQAYDELRHTQQSAMQEERLRALGQMASGIAHDINNALSPVSLYAESLLETEVNLSERGRTNLETILRAVEDVAHTVARMREFYRQREQQLELAPVDLNELIRQVLNLTKARWSDQALQHGIAIEPQVELATDLPVVMGVESEIREALVNLVFNAVDAMPEGGTLLLRTRMEGIADEPRVALEVIDSGVGMDAETRRRCLEPFFTSKGERGTGLGLAMVFGMAKRHSAELEIDSAPGNGTTMRLIFAASPAAIAGDGEPLAGTDHVPRELRLLLIDDDPVLLRSLRDALEMDGHDVVTANGGETGISAFRQFLEAGNPFNAVITDLGMPHVDGRKVAAAIKALSADVPVIMLTGWGRRMVADGEIPPHVDRVLAKPPRLRELRQTLAQLDRANPRGLASTT